MSALTDHAVAVPAMSAIRNFLEWCEEQKIELAEWLPRGERMLPVTEGREPMLLRYFEIDAVQLEKERRALLKQASDLTASVAANRARELAKPKPRSTCPGCFSAIYDGAAKQGWCTHCCPKEEALPCE